MIIHDPLPMPELASPASFRVPVAPAPVAPLTADEAKCVEACVAAIVSVFAESNKNTDDARGIEPESAVDALAAIACQIIRRGSPLPAGGVA